MLRIIDLAFGQLSPGTQSIADALGVIYAGRRTPWPSWCGRELGTYPTLIRFSGVVRALRMG